MKKLGSLKTVHRAELKIKSPGENSKPIEEKNWGSVCFMEQAIFEMAKNKIFRKETVKSKAESETSSSRHLTLWPTGEAEFDLSKNPL